MFPSSLRKRSRRWEPPSPGGQLWDETLSLTRVPGLNARLCPACQKRSGSSQKAASMKAGHCRQKDEAAERGAAPRAERDGRGATAQPPGAGSPRRPRAQQGPVAAEKQKHDTPKGVSNPMSLLSPCIPGFQAGTGRSGGSLAAGTPSGESPVF